MSPANKPALLKATRPSVAARHLLPLEMALATIASLPLGMNLLFGGGPLWQLAHRLGTPDAYTGNLVWGLAFLLPGIALFATATTEWMIGRRWSTDKMRHSVLCRFWASTVLLLANLSLVGMLIAEQAAGAVPGAVMIAMMAIPFHFWVAWKTRQLTAIYDPNIATDRLQSTIAAQRW